jgi:hypothetical protein
MDFCDCEDWKTLSEQNRTLFVYDERYGWIIRWIEISKEKGYSQAHTYGININHCPMCGKRLKELSDVPQ